MDIDSLEEITPKDSVVPVYLESLSDEEIEKRRLDYEKFLEMEEKEKAEKIKKEEAIRTAIHKLSKLGLTEEEAKAIAGV